MERKWWKEAVVYQIYPRSFYDSNGDGIGDLRGIIQKLDYIKDLGVDVIWLCPIYKSPNADNGYDISDYYDIMDEFGTMEDFDELLSEVHKRGMKLIMDLVINHTSDEHPWFIESRSSKDNPKRDYYIWRPPRDGKEPNNWRSFFHGSAWEWDEKTGEYYLHLFAKKQPDLNWKNPEVKKEIFKMIKWWLDKGIDGFRMDVINLIGKAEGLPDGKNKDNFDDYVMAPEHWANQPLVHEVLHEMNRQILSKYDIMTVGETPFVTPEIGALYVNEDREELNMIFQFEHMDLPDFKDSNLLKFKKIQKKWYEALKEKGWNSQYLNNHDQPRQVSRFGDDQNYRKESAKLLATMLLTLPGTPYIYQGEEIGMTNVKFSSIEEYNDIDTVNYYHEEVAKGRDPEEVLKELMPKSRDNARTPVQWTAGKNAGFTTGTPWLKVNPNYKQINVEEAQKDPDSVLNYYKKLIRLRKREENLALIYGNYIPLFEDHEKIYSYIRQLDNDRFLIILNFSKEKLNFTLDEIPYKDYQLLIANYPVQDEKLEQIKLRPYEARIYRLR
ncbi:glucohydrolase [Anoxybacter fermentans]|uniref:Glucohydrolase n=1 Tax=Anoxybacter fermentans TaxID=1323375 RepID=A0A3S9SXJ8_9FIRM|nr:alpha-glucosidase [Anoxybacter fermentans]AZR72972.1 glucohydrolase [Anoxybacter fermentans]